MYSVVQVSDSTISQLPVFFKTFEPAKRHIQDRAMDWATTVIERYPGKDWTNNEGEIVNDLWWQDNEPFAIYIKGDWISLKGRVDENSCTVELWDWSIPLGKVAIVKQTTFFLVAPPSVMSEKHQIHADLC